MNILYQISLIDLFSCIWEITLGNHGYQWIDGNLFNTYSEVIIATGN